MNKGDRLTLRIDRLTLGGDGLGRAGNAVVFVPYGSPGDTVEIELSDVRKNFARGKLLRVLEPSAIRIKPPCQYHFQSAVRSSQSADESAHSALRTANLPCGGCSWQHLTYDFQLDAKRELVQETLERIGGVSEIEVRPTLGMKDPWRYRNKVQPPVGFDGRNIITGFYTPFSHDIVPIEDCLVQPELSVAIVNRARDLLQRFHLHPYNAERNQGWIRHLLVRTTTNIGTVPGGDRPAVASSPSGVRHQDRGLSHQKEFIQELTQQFPTLAGIHQNVNPGKTNVILGREWRKVWGEDTIEERLGELRFRLSPGSFFQVNTLQAEVLYNIVKEWAGTGDSLLDVYCGVGGIALYLAANFQRVYGVDEVKSAVDDAQKNAALNGIKNAYFTADSAARYLNRFRTPGGQKDHLTVVLDPPRAGCEPQVLRALSQLRPSHLIYVSCDPGTLARDLGILSQSGFRTQDVQPVDLFPHTPHIETVVRLTGLKD